MKVIRAAPSILVPKKAEIIEWVRICVDADD